MLGSGDYREVIALAQAPMRLAVRGLALAPRHELPPIDDAFIALGDPDPAMRSFLGRDAPLAPVGRDELLTLAQAASQAGARRLVMLAPAPLWQQVGRLHLGLSGELELALTRLPFRAITLLRPVVESSGGARGWVERLASVYTSLQMLAMPRHLSVLPSAQLARAAMAAMRGANEGIRIYGADRIPELLQPRGVTPPAAAPDPGERP